MLFNSLEFAAFAAVVLLLYHGLDHRRQNTLLLVASYTFYAAWDWRFLSLIMLSTCVDYVAALKIGDNATEDDHDSQRKRWLYVSVGTKLGLLGFF